MKTSFRLPVAFWFCLSAACLLHGQQPANSGIAPSLPSPTPYSIVQQDGNSQVRERTVYELGPSGQAVLKEHRYTELATGLNFRDPTTGQWTPSKAEIAILPNGTAAATQGQHQAYFPGDIAQGVIELDTPDGLKLQSRPIGLSYDDGTNTVLFAVLTNSLGELLGSNRVIYPNAFQGAAASLRYTYTRAGFEQDILIQEQLPPPETFGLDSANARLQVLTEFFSPPQPAVEANSLPAQGGMTLTDQNLSFGVMQVVPGCAFLAGSDSQVSGVFVAKSWVTLDGRQFLVEEAPVSALAEELSQLPSALVASASSRNPSKHPMASRKLRLPAQHFSKAKGGSRLTRSSQLSETKPELVLDYVTLSGSVTNYVFQGGMTYYISGNLALSGTNTFEGGAIIKYASSGPTITVLSSAAVNWLAAPYRPVVFTAVDDNSAGESFGSGTPSGYYAGVALDFAGQNVPTLSGFRVLYAQTGFLTSSGSTVPTLRDGQFDICRYAAQFSGSAAYLRNVLFANIRTNFVNLAAPVVDLQNVTFNNVTSLASIASGSPDFYLTNCILANVTNAGVSLSSFAGDFNGFYNSPEFGNDTLTNTVSPFQTVGGGNYYLATNSPDRNAGTTNIDLTLVADLATKTTYPPIVYANATISLPTTFSPQAQRDIDTPDLGYHYDPLDYVFAETEVDSNITFTAGTAVGWYRTTSGWYDAGDGIHLMNGATANLTGTATAPVWWVRLNTVQEQDLSGGYGPGGLTSWGSGPPSFVAIIQARFLHTSAFDSDGDTIRDDGCCGGGHLVVNATDCEFYGTGVAGYYMTLDFTNCLLFRNEVGAQSDHNDAGLTLQNCTFHGGDWYDVVVQHWSGATWPVYIVSSAFENCDFEDVDTNYSYYDYNAFIQGQNRLPISGAHDVIVTNSFNWQTSWLGSFYQPTNSQLLHMGNTNANLLGLYHFTTQTNQTVEGTNIVSIGYHYVAVTNGIPLDSNGDGIPDYLEDANGNGLVDSGEIGWNIVGDLGLQVLITQPRNGSILP